MNPEAATVIPKKPRIPTPPFEKGAPGGISAANIARDGRKFLLLTALGAAPAWAHHAPLHVDVVCTSGDTIPGLALLPFLVLAVVGVVRAVHRSRKDR